eukprot:745739_1
MISNFLNRKKHKKKDKKHKNDKHTSHSNDSSSSYNKMNGSHPTPSIDRTQSDKFSNGHHNKNHLPPNNPSAQSSHSHDDMTADDIKKKQRKFQKKASKKRHSHIGAMRAHQSFKNGIGKSLHVPGDIKEEDETQNNNNNNHKQNGKTSSNNNTSYGTGHQYGGYGGYQPPATKFGQMVSPFLNYYYLLSQWFVFFSCVMSLMSRVYYYRALYATIIMYIINTIQTNGKPQMNMYYAQRVMQDENIMIAIYAAIFLMGNPLIIFLFPIMLRSLFMG